MYKRQLPERVRIHAARFDLGKGGFPHARHFYIGDLLVLDYLVNGKPLVGCLLYTSKSTKCFTALKKIGTLD